MIDFVISCLKIKEKVVYKTHRMFLSPGFLVKCRKEESFEEKAIT
jgi:hypothetical protein